MPKKWIGALFVLVLVVPLALTACGDEKKAEDLNQTFESTLGLTLKYPEGWVVKDVDGGILIANTAEMAAQMEADNEEPFPKGGFGLMIFDPSMLIGAGQSPRDVVDGFATAFADENTTVDDPKDVKVGNNQGAKVTFKSNVQKGEGFLIAWNEDGTTYMVIALAYEGKLDEYDATAQKILESIDYNASATEEGGEG